MKTMSRPTKSFNYLSECEHDKYYLMLSKSPELASSSDSETSSDENDSITTQRRRISEHFFLN